MGTHRPRLAVVTDSVLNSSPCVPLLLMAKRAAPSPPPAKIFVRTPTEDDVAAFAHLDLAFTAGLQVDGRPELPGYGQEWFRRRLSPSRTRFLKWRGVSLLSEDTGKMIGGAIWSLESAALPRGGSKGRKRPRRQLGQGQGQRRQRRIQYVELFWIYVDAAYRGNGYGRLLETEALRRARMEWGGGGRGAGAGAAAAAAAGAAAAAAAAAAVAGGGSCGNSQAEQCRLHVLETNLKAIDFYTRLGYRVTAVKDAYPVKGWSCKRMVRDLTRDVLPPYGQEGGK